MVLRVYHAAASRRRAFRVVGLFAVLGCAHRSPVPVQSFEGKIDVRSATMRADLLTVRYGPEETLVRARITNTSDGPLVVSLGASLLENDGLEYAPTEVGNRPVGASSAVVVELTYVLRRRLGSEATLVLRGVQNSAGFLEPLRLRIPPAAPTSPQSGTAP